MRFIPVVLAVASLSLATVNAQQKQTYVGIVTDTMCNRDHKAMNHTGPEDKCVRDCVGDGKTYKYALADAKGVYLLSDQETPAKFAGKKVKGRSRRYSGDRSRGADPARAGADQVRGRVITSSARGWRGQEHRYTEFR